MSTETIMWLLPIVFMLHDFEEIIMMKPWIGREQGALMQRFPRFMGRIIPHVSKLSTSSFSFAVLFMFALITVLTLISVECKLYSLWSGFLVGFGLHAIIHIIQFIVYRKYVPVIITSFPALLYSLLAFYTVYTRLNLEIMPILLWSMIAVTLLPISVLVAHYLAGRFETWLSGRF